MYTNSVLNTTRGIMPFSKVTSSGLLPNYPPVHTDDCLIALYVLAVLNALSTSLLPLYRRLVS